MTEPIAFIIFVLTMIGFGTVLWSVASTLQEMAQRYYDRTK